MTSAIIETGGKQYRVIPGQLLRVEKLEAKVGDKVTFDRVLVAVVDGTVHTGAPFLADQPVAAEVVEQGKGVKIRVFTYKSKKRQRRTLGHRQTFTAVKILGIGASKEKAQSPKPEAAAKKPAAPKAKKTA